MKLISSNRAPVAKSSILILGVIAFATIVYVGMQSLPLVGTSEIQETEADSSAWKTYTNSQYAFELKIPKNFSVRERPPDRDAPYFSVYFDDNPEDSIFSISRVVVDVSKKGPFDLQAKVEEEKVRLVGHYTDEIFVNQIKNGVCRGKRVDYEHLGLGDGVMWTTVICDEPRSSYYYTVKGNAELINEILPGLRILDQPFEP